jgi:hypothetical protein
MRADVLDLNMSEQPHFVVTVTSPNGTDWLSEPNETGVRSLVPRESAAVFRSIEDARDAIARMHQELASVGALFSIEACKRREAVD